MLSTNVWNALRRRYKTPEWALFSEVRDKLGWAGKGSCDALAFGLWPSRGMAMLGFEIKTDRGDWLRELKKPEKAERFATLCDEWWVVTTPDVIRDESELPSGWGWLYLAKRGRIVAKNLKVKRAATPKPNHPELPREFIAALLRRAHAMTEEGDLIKAAREEGYDNGFEEGRKKNEAASEIRVLKSQVSAAQREVKLYEQAVAEAGMADFDSWDFPRLAKYVKMLQGSDPGRVVMSYRQALRNAEGIVTSLQDALKHAEDDLG
jgi:hypothetical protein